MHLSSRHPCRPKRSRWPLPVMTSLPPPRRAPARHLPLFCRFWSPLLTNPSSKGISAVVLTPTRELAIQIDEVYNRLAQGTGIRAAVVVGGLSERTQLNAIRQGARVLIATPGRLSDFLKRKLVDLSKTSIFVLDEADRMLDMGFLPTVRSDHVQDPARAANAVFLGDD